MKEYFLKKALQKHFKNNRQSYELTGYSILYENGTFKVTYNNSDEYIINIKTEENIKYLKLTPYHNSYFKTEISLKELKSKVDMTLFALKENERLYK